MRGTRKVKVANVRRTVFNVRPSVVERVGVGDVVHTNQDGIFLQQVKRAISASIKVFA